MPDPLTDPAAAAAARARQEYRVRRATETATASLLRDVRALAAGRDALWSLTLGRIHARWAAYVEAILPVITSILPVYERPWYAATITPRLLESPIPLAAHTSASAVLSLAAANAWAARTTHDTLADNLTPTAHPVQADPTAPTGLAPIPEATTYQSQAREHARTETTLVCSHGTYTGVVGEGYTHKRWIAHHDAIVRPTHAAADGQTVPAYATFDVGGVPMLYPGDPAAPPRETANCRCVIVGVAQ